MAATERVTCKEKEMLPAELHTTYVQGRNAAGGGRSCPQRGARAPRTASSRPSTPHPCLLRAPAHQQWRGPAAPIRRCRTGHSGHPPAAGGGDSGSSSPKRAEQEGEKVLDEGGNSGDSWMSTRELALEENTIRENCVELGFCTWGQRPAHDSLNSCHPKL